MALSRPRLKHRDRIGGTRQRDAGSHCVEALRTLGMARSGVMEGKFGVTRNQQPHPVRVPLPSVRQPGSSYPLASAPVCAHITMTQPSRPITADRSLRPLRVVPWRGHTDVVIAGPVPGTQPSRPHVERLIDHAHAAGLRQVFTIALAPAEQQPFIDAGFVHHEHLHLLRHDLSRLPAAGDCGHRLRRARRRDINAVLDVDNLAFDDFWSFDHQALSDARSATPTHRFRVASRAGGEATTEVAGYSITGRSRRICYLQRLAVHPGQQRNGIGTALVCDALGWARSRRAHSLLVNTQQGNTTALNLYLGLGFEQQPLGLDVLQWAS
jgi:ribosomal protein S18 acetylase RimI-like enzyme